MKFEKFLQVTTFLCWCNETNTNNVVDVNNDNYFFLSKHKPPSFIYRLIAFLLLFQTYAIHWNRSLKSNFFSLVQINIFYPFSRIRLNHRRICSWVMICWNTYSMKVVRQCKIEKILMMHIFSFARYLYINIEVFICLTHTLYYPIFVVLFIVRWGSILSIYFKILFWYIQLYL